MYTRAEQPAQPEGLIDVNEVVSAYYDFVPSPAVLVQKIVFGTSGHHGSSLDAVFNGAHIVATTATIIEYHRSQGIDGTLYLSRSTYALSEPAQRTAVGVFAGAGVITTVNSRGAYTPALAVSHSILLANGAETEAEVHTSGPGLADGIVVTPSHNPPHDGGFKYNPPTGGPAGSEATTWIANRTNKLPASGWQNVPRVPVAEALDGLHIIKHNYLEIYVTDLESVIDLEVVRKAGVRIGADPLDGASTDYWDAIGERYSLELAVVSPRVDPAWHFMTLDWDGKIRMDYSSPNAMASLRSTVTPDVEGKTPYDAAAGNDADSDRHGTITPDDGLVSPNHFLAVTIEYLFTHWLGWPADTAVGKTLVSSSLTDRVTAAIGRTLIEVPVGFRHFTPGLLDGSIGFGGEGSAGASFLRRGGIVWATDRDGIILALLTSEIITIIGKSPSQLHREQVERFGASVYARVDTTASKEEKVKLATLAIGDVTATELAGEEITARLIDAPGNGAPIDGLRVTTRNVWFTAHPSGTEDVYEIYAEPFKGADYLAQVQEEAKKVVAVALGD